MLSGLKTLPEGDPSGFACPVCGGALRKRGSSLLCAESHCYDIAKSGYVNLMSGGSGGTSHGDNREMVLARRDFLDAGYYEPLRSALCTALAGQLAEPSDGRRFRLLDAGCGECWYTAGISKYLAERGVPNTACGVDISKDALIYGAKRDPALRLAAASIYRIPAADGAFDALLNIFSPFCAAEYGRVLRTGGLLVRAVPLPRHLYSLKKAVYDEVYENALPDEAVEGFILADSADVEDVIELRDSGSITALFSMTPYRYNTTSEGLRRLAALTSLSTEISFRALIYRKI